MISLRQAARALLAGEIIAFPTESFWALGVLATKSDAIDRLFRAKYREKNKPIALIAASRAQVEAFFHLSATEKVLADRFWPGSLTILLKPKASIAAKSLGARYIGVRVPAHAASRKLAAIAGAPITATSANESGQPATKSGRVVARAFPDIERLSGACGRQRLPSTIVRFRGRHMTLIRQGAVPMI